MKPLTNRQKKKIERTLENKRSYKAIVYGRFFTCLISVFLQLCFYAAFLTWFAYGSPYATIAQVVAMALALIFVLHLINRNDRPSSKMSWIIFILVFPVFGVAMYLFNGGGRPTRKMNHHITAAKRDNLEKLDAYYGQRPLPTVNDRRDGVTRYLAEHCNYPVFYDGEIDYYKCGEDMFPVMIEELQKAKKFILLDYFIIAPGKMWYSILDILREKAEKGVQIRIIYDDFGSMMTLPPKYERYLESLHENIKCMTFNNVVPLFAVRMNNRDHRKILVVDGRVAFTGGINLADEYIGEKVRFGYWKDSGVRVKGNAVASFTHMFFYMWNACRNDKEDIRNYLIPQMPEKYTEENTTFRLQPYADSPLDSISAGETVYVDIINRAVNYVYIFTPYLVLDDMLRASLCRAALRGVDVRIVTPGIPDKKMVYRLTRANYAVLMKAGVKIYEYTPGFIHSKSMVCDDEYAVVGTMNFDYRSLYLHFENAVYFSGCQAVIDLKRDCEETFAVSKACTQETNKRGFIGRWVDAVLRVFENLL
ncbi:MAG: cardiolipin synthase [Clostridia bacterium]|nr:cardiolipin synthase [Clostridia bacterium]